MTSRVTVVPFDLVRTAVEAQQSVEDAGSGFGRLKRAEIEISAEGNDKQVSVVYVDGSWHLRVEAVDHQ